MIIGLQVCISVKCCLVYRASLTCTCVDSYCMVLTVCVVVVFLVGTDSWKQYWAKVVVIKEADSSLCRRMNYCLTSYELSPIASLVWNIKKLLRILLCQSGRICKIFLVWRTNFTSAAVFLWQCYVLSVCCIF